MVGRATSSLVRQVGRDPADLHYVVVDVATCVAVVSDDHVALDDGVPRARTSAVRACRTTLEFVAFFRKKQGSRERISSAVQGLRFFHRQRHGRA